MLRDVYAPDGEPRPDAVSLLFALLAERPPAANISHQHMPSFEEHLRFVRSRPYRRWFVVEIGIDGRGQDGVGAVYATEKNEIGVAILDAHRRHGYARAAIVELMGQLDPLPAERSVRRGEFIARVAPGNKTSQAFFEQALGAKLIELTYELRKERVPGSNAPRGRSR
jgi:RimJ/RimL family protein N-acetyltransferase